MNSDKLIQESFPQDKAQQFGEILKDAVSSYIEHKDSCNVNEWLYSYLTAQLPDKSTEEISVITGYEKERIEIFCETHMLPKQSDDEIQEMVKSCINGICESRGVELYRL